MWKPEGVELPKGLKLDCTIADFCRIANFAEPEDVVNVGGRYMVSWKWGTFKGQPLIRERSFYSKTHANSFIDLLKECGGVVILSGPTFKIQLLFPEFEGKRFVNAHGSIEEAVRGVL